MYVPPEHPGTLYLPCPSCSISPGRSACRERPRSTLSRVGAGTVVLAMKLPFVVRVPGCFRTAGAVCLLSALYHTKGTLWLALLCYTPFCQLAKQKEAEMEFGKRIRAARKAAGLSQEALARRADVSLGSVRQLEQGGINDPHYSTVRKIAEGLGMPVSELLQEPAYAEDILPKAQASPPSESEGRRWAGAWADLFESGLRVASEYVHTHLQGPATIIPVRVALDIQRLQARLGQVLAAEGGWERLAPLEVEQDPEAARLFRASERLHELVGLANRLAHPSPEEEERLQQELNDLREGLAKTESGTPHGA